MLQETAFGTVPKTFQLIEKLLEDPFLTPISGAENLVLSAFGLVLVLFWITNWSDNDFFNSLERFWDRLKSWRQFALCWAGLVCPEPPVCPHT